VIEYPSVPVRANGKIVGTAEVGMKDGNMVADITLEPALAERLGLPRNVTTRIPEEHPRIPGGIAEGAIGVTPIENKLTTEEGDMTLKEWIERLLEHNEKTSDVICNSLMLIDKSISEHGLSLEIMRKNKIDKSLIQVCEDSHEKLSFARANLSVSKKSIRTSSEYLDYLKSLG
jgi:hypothetical protein